jgi:hypothetical protein
VVVNFSVFLRLPVWWSDISLIPIQKQWRHITSSSSRHNVNAICSKYDVVPITLLWPLASHYPIVGDNRTNDWLLCCVAETDRYRERDEWQAMTMRKQWHGIEHDATASPSMNRSWNHEDKSAALVLPLTWRKIMSWLEMSPLHKHSGRSFCIAYLF